VIKNVLIDVDGVIWQGGKKIAGAEKTINYLREKKYKFMLVTNISRITKKKLVKSLSGQGVKIKESEILGPTEATISYIQSRKKNASCFLIAANEIKKEFKKAGLKVIEKGANADFVVVFLHFKTDYKMLDDAFQHLLGGAELVTNAEGKSYPLKEGGKPSLGVGAFVKGLEFCSGKKAHLVGKPNPEFFMQAMEKIGAGREETVMVGDSISSDVTGAKNTGIKAVLVKTGSFSQEELEKSHIKPDAVIESIAGLPRYLEENK